ncbi:MAG: O-antigen ligase family protein, partial [Candidatus Brocadiae bacterium]|nr:O-antigen ligase family protein [Candidatus Brocadiia bacterium]
MQTLAALICVGAALHWAGRRPWPRRPSLNWRHVFPLLVGAYAAWSALTYLWSAWPYGTRAYLIRELPFYVLCVTAMLLCGRPQRWLTVAKVFVVAAFAEAVLQSALIFYMVPHTEPEAGRELTLGFVFLKNAVFYSNRNFACAILLTGAFIAVGFLIHSVGELLHRGAEGGSGRRWRAFTVVAVPVALIAFGFVFVVADSLAGYVAAAIALVAYVLCILPIKRKGLIVLILIAATGTAMMAVVASDRLWRKSLRAALSPRRTTHLRVVDWLAAAELYMRRPVHGWGMGTFPATYARFHPALARKLPFTGDKQTTHPHNEFVRIAAEQGMIGLLLYAGILIYAFSVSYVALRDRPARERLVGYALWAGTLTFVVQGTFGKAPMNWSFAANYWILLGVLASAS